MDESIGELTAILAGAGTLATARDAFRRFAVRAGVGCHAYASFAAGGSIRYLDTTYPEPWITRYHAMNYRAIDPVVARARCTLTPFDWGFLAGLPLAPAQRRLFDEAAQFGLGDGYTIPFEPRDGGFALLCLAFETSQCLRQALATHPGLPGIGRCYHAAVDRLTASRRDEDGQRLSSEECRSLKGIAAGESLWQIATALGLPEANVGRLLRTARTKIGARTTAEAVAIAEQSGLLTERSAAVQTGRQAGKRGRIRGETPPVR